MAKSYYDKLKDPKWQRKRLQILERDHFKCRFCGSDNQTLHIHHIQYIKVGSPWDYPDKYLITLCGDCHKKEEDYSYIIKDRIVDLVNNGQCNLSLSVILMAINKASQTGSSEKELNLCLELITEMIECGKEITSTKAFQL